MLCYICELENQHSMKIVWIFPPFHTYTETVSPSAIHAQFAVVYRHGAFIDCFQSFLQCSRLFDISMRMCIFHDCAIALNQLRRIHSHHEWTTHSHFAGEHNSFSCTTWTRLFVCFAVARVFFAENNLHRLIRSTKKCVEIETKFFENDLPEFKFNHFPCIFYVPSLILKFKVINRNKKAEFVQQLLRCYGNLSNSIR